MHLPALDFATSEQVWDALAEHVQALEPREVSVGKAFGRVLAEDVTCLHDFPPFDRAVMDGYAVRCEAFADGSARLRVCGLRRAGFDAGPAVTADTCVRINTGAPMPEGADAVVMVEKSTAVADDEVELDDAPAPGQHIEYRAGLRRVGDLLVSAGARIGPGVIAAIVAGGTQRVRVFPAPRACLLSTGDEIVAAGRSLESGQIHDSNSVSLAALIRAAGGGLDTVQRCPDESEATRAALESGLQCDLLCVVGGMSKGSHDLVPGLLESLGVQWLVTSMNLKPGKPMRIGRSPAGGWVIGLPGNPVSAAVCFLLFGRSLLAGLQGQGIRPAPRAAATLECDIPGNGPRPMVQPADWTLDTDGASRIAPVAWKGSGDPFGLASANALLVRPASAEPAPRGTTVPFIPIDEAR